MKICFSDFWTPFDFNNNFFVNLLRELYENVEVTTPENADVMFFSVFGNENTLYKDCKKIFYTGENVRPDFNKCDYSLTFDFDDYGGKNFRLPLWYFYIDWFKVGTYDNPEWLIPESYLYGENEFTKKEKNKFCSIVFSRLVDNRANTIEVLSSYKSVDKFGKCYNSSYLPEGEKPKLDLISNYKFSICYENSLYPGYYTEKLLHAKVAGTIPIYLADQNFSKDFNPNCCINTLNMSFEQILDKVKEIDCDDNLYHNIRNQPLFKEKVSLDSITKNIISILK